MEIKIDYWIKREGITGRILHHGLLTDADILDLAIVKYRENYEMKATEQIEATIDNVII